MILINLKNYCSYFSNIAFWAIANFCILFITTFRPLLGPDSICPFALGCTQFAILTLQNKPLLVALPMVCKRLLSCNPISIWLRRKKTQSTNENQTVL